jgi:hypothetical protein
MISLNCSFTAKYVVYVLSMSNQNGEKLLFLNTSPKRPYCHNVLLVVTSMIFSYCYYTANDVVSFVLNNNNVFFLCPIYNINKASLPSLIVPYK